MRDKVKRFISILMTALMLVNLLPVGALAEGMKLDSNSVQSRASKKSANVYVYVKVTGDKAGLTINQSGWYTIGKSENVPGMGTPYWFMHGSHSFSDVGVSYKTVLKTNFTRWTDNQKIDLDQITWTEFYVDNGADDYVKAGTYTWHMNGTIDIKHLPSVYTIKYVDYDTKELIHSYEKTGLMGQTPEKVTAPDSLQENLYSFYFVNGHPKEQTVDFKKDKGELTFYYKKNTAAYTVNYYLNGTKTKVAEPKKRTAALGKSVTESPITVEGYTPVSNDSQTITIKANSDKNVINFYYYKNVTLTANSDTATYDGKEHSVSGFTGAPDGADFRAITVGAAGTNVGTYDAIFPDGTKGTVDGTGKYIVTEATDGKLEITPKTIKVTVTGNTDTKVYTGETQSVVDFTTDAPEGVTVELKSGKEAKAEGQNVGTYYMGLTKEDFEVESQNYAVELSVNDGWLEITPQAIKVTVTGNTDTKVYTGETQSVVDFTTDAPEGVTVELKSGKEAKAEGQNVGTYYMGLTKEDFEVESQNYAVELSVTDGWLEITPRKVTLTSATLIKDYDGTPLKNGDAPVKEEFGTEKAFPEGEGVTYTFTGSQTNAGSSKNMFTYAWNEGTKADNYTICPIEGDLVVTPIDGIKVTITGHKDTQTYDGKPHKVEGYDVKPDNLLFTEKDIKFNGEAEATGTDVRIDPYQMGLKPEQFTNTSNNFTNVEFVVEDGQIVITPRAVTLTSETAGKTYDGTALEKPVVTVGGDGFVEGQVTEIKATGSVTNAGSVANTITFTPNKETFKDGNYAITKTEGTLTIAKRSVLITSQSATKTYDGSALTRPAVTITGDGFVPGELAKAEATGSITYVGSTPNTIQYTTTGAFNAANYSIALSVGTLTVTEKPKPEPRRTFNLTISYVYQNGKRAAASYNRGGLKNGETFDITSPVIAGYTASETVVSGTIYNRDIKVTVIYTADGVNLDDYGVPLGLGNITMNVGDCFE